MNSFTYYCMKEGIAYHAEYSLGGKCLIKKAAEDFSLGIVTAKFPDGTIKRRHHAFFKILMAVNDSSF